MPDCDDQGAKARTGGIYLALAQGAGGGQAATFRKKSVPKPRRPLLLATVCRSRLQHTVEFVGGDGVSPAPNGARPDPGELRMSTIATRLEHDLLGEKAVPADAYYGVQTARALENFHISGVELRLYPNLIKALAMVKLAAARANFDCGQFSRRSWPASRAPAARSSTARLHDQFRLDVFQGGAGTSTNMNANEVIANRALELMGHQQGRVQVLRPARSRQLLAVHQRRLSDGAARRHGARQHPSSSRRSTS